VQTVLVTGAAGTVGHYAVALAEAAGYRVIATDRLARGVSQPVRGEVRPGDLTDARFVERVVRGCDHVIHTAALLEANASREDLQRVNTRVVEQLYDAAEAAGVKRFLHVSTAVLYQATGRAALAEDAAIEPRGEHGESKLAAESYLRGRPRHGTPAWTILRAAPIYGRRGRHFAASLLAVGPILRLWTPFLPRPTGGPVHSLVHAEDVARALVFALGHDGAAHQVLNVADEDPIALGDRLTDTFRAYGLRTIPTGRLPPAALRVTGDFFRAPGAYHGADVTALAAWRLVVLRHGLRAALRPRLDREALQLLYEDLVVDASKLRGLGWTARYPRFAEGWREVLRWYQAEGWVPRYA
jgi:UDP-glucose 4-epimerase